MESGILKQSKGQALAGQIKSKIRQLFQRHQRDVAQMNMKLKQKGLNQINELSDQKMKADFYKRIQSANLKLKTLHKQITQMQSLPHPSKVIYQNKVFLFAGIMEKLHQKQNLKVKIGQFQMQQVIEVQQLSDACSKQVQFNQIQYKKCCCFRNESVKPILQKLLLDLISHIVYWYNLQGIQPIKVYKNEYQSTTFNPRDFSDLQYIHHKHRQSIINICPQMIKVQANDKSMQTDAQPIPGIDPNIIEHQRIVNEISKQLEDHKELAHALENELQSLKNQNNHLQDIIKEENSMRVAHQLMYGIGRPKHQKKGVELLLKLEEEQSHQIQNEKNPQIYNILGSVFEEGEFVQKNLDKSVKYYLKSAAMGNPQGYYKMGKFIEKAQINPQQLFSKAYKSKKEEIIDIIEHYEKAAAAGHLDAMTDLGFIYEHGIKKEQSLHTSKVSHSVVSKSEDNNTSQGEYLIQPNIQVAKKYYSKAKKENFPRAINNLGALYVRQYQNMPQTVKGSNLSKGIKLLQRAVDLKYSKAYINLGKCYQNGIGVDRNIAKASQLYLSGALRNDISAKMHYIRCMMANKSEHDSESKILYLVDSIKEVVKKDKKNSEALFYMGQVQQKNIGANYKESAFNYIQKAAKLGYPPAIVKLGDYYYSGFHVQQDYQLAKQCYSQAAALNHPQALINLGLMANNQPNSKDNSKIAETYFKDAAKKGDPNAIIHLGSNKSDRIMKQHLKQAASMGSYQAMRILSKTKRINRNQMRSPSPSPQLASHYVKQANHYIKQANITPRAMKSQSKTIKTPNPQAQKHQFQATSGVAYERSQKILNEYYNNDAKIIRRHKSSANSDYYQLN